MAGKERGGPDKGRRQFIKAAAASGVAAAGLLNAPFMGGRARAVDNGPKEPDTVYSACLACNARCGIKAVVEGGRLKAIGGNPYHPYNTLGSPVSYDTPAAESEKGSGGCAHGPAATVCAKAVDSMSYIYNPYRILRPLKRAGRRGEGRFEPISWEQLIREISFGGRLFAHLGEDRHVPGLAQLDSDDPIMPDDPALGPVRNGFVFISGRMQPGRKAFIDRFVKSSFGSINRIGHTDICGLGFRMGNFAFTEGKQVEMKADPWSAEYILVFGSNIYSALQPGVNTYGAAVALRRSRGELKFTIVDPRGHEAAAHADRWVAVRPGRDGAFAMGMIRWMIENGALNIRYLAAPNRRSAARLGNGAYCNASHLVITDPEHEDHGRFLRLRHLNQEAQEGIGDAFMVMEAPDGGPVHFEKASEAIFDFAGRVSAPGGREIQVKSAFRLMKESVMARGLDEYAQAAGVSPEEIAEVAREFSSHAPRAAVCQYHGAGNYTGGTYAAYAVAVLNALVGSVERRGGYMSGGGSPASWKHGAYEMVDFPGRRKPSGIRISREKACYEKSAEYRRKRASGGSGYPALRPWFAFTKGGLCVETLAGIDQGYPYPCRVLFTYFFNPVYSIPGGYRFSETLKDQEKVPLHVSIDIGINESNIYADYIVPDVTFAEGHYAWLHPHAPAQRFCALRSPLIEPLTGRTPDGRPYCLETFLIDLARQLDLPGFGARAIPDGTGAVLPLNKAEDFYLRAMANIALGAGLPEAEGKELEMVERSYPASRHKGVLKEGHWRRLCYALARGGVFEPYDGLFSGEAFRYGVERVVLYNEELASARNSLTGEQFPGTLSLVLPADARGRVIAELDRDYPFYLITHKMNIHTQSRTIWHDTARKIVPSNRIVMHVDDARSLGLEQGQRVRLVSRSRPQGVTGRLSLTPLIRRGCIAVSNHYGHTQLGASRLWIRGGSRVFLGGSSVMDGDFLIPDSSLGAGLSPNRVTNLDPALADTPMVDLTGGIPDFSSTRVRVERA